MNGCFLLFILCHLIIMTTALATTIDNDNNDNDDDNAIRKNAEEDSV